MQPTLRALRLLPAVLIALSAFADVNRDLLRAAEEGDLPKVAKLLARGAHVNARDRSSRTPLIYAAGRGHASVAQVLLTKGADANARDETGQTALIYATQGCHSPIVQALLARGADAAVANRSGGTPLLYATMCGNTASVEGLLAGGADVNASTKPWPDSVEALMGTHPDPQGRLWQSFLSLLNRGFGDGTVLMIAAALDKPEIVSALLRGGANVNARNSLSWTPLMFAVLTARPEIVRMILAKGADANAVSDGMLTVTERFMAGVGPPVLGFREDGRLDFVPGPGNTGLTTISPSVSRVQGTTALMLAAARGDMEIVKALLAAGADVNARNSVGRSVMGVAAARGQTGVLELLRQAGAKE